MDLIQAVLNMPISEFQATNVKGVPVPEAMVKTGKLELTWDNINEDFLNWRKQSRVTEVWLIRER